MSESFSDHDRDADLPESGGQQGDGLRSDGTPEGEAYQPIVCPHCGGDAREGDRCWLCGASLEGGGARPIEVSPWAPRNLEPPPEPPLPPVTFSLSTVILIITLCAICFGILRIAPGLAIPLCILLVPVFCRTYAVVRRREARGRSVSAVQKASLFAGSFAVAVVMAVVVGVIAFGAFCSVCAMIVGVSFNEPESFAFLIIMVPLTIGGIYGLKALIKWSRRRYRRDIEE